ncbi:phosphatidylinositol-specific phospholipase C domain-containing protein [Floridanema evergladense]|uniref:1-phosphatidylinositol phosphodiesterase n=1 Tax=Floridaenema evergladense BLCC-F167 TaxID=3153639 RepID=A0ABV4WV44_9CYAN
MKHTRSIAYALVLGIFISIFMLVFTPPATAATINSAKWMEQLAPRIGDKPLREIYIPGTHDSGTYGLIPSHIRPIDDVFAPDANNGLLRFGTYIGVTDAWAKAQEKTIYQQLVDGIRHLDLRPCTEKNGTLRICHGMYGPLMQYVLKDIKKFASENPKEIVIVEFGGISVTLPEKVEEEVRKLLENDADLRLQKMIQSELGQYLVDHSKVTPTSTPNEIWNTQAGKSLIVIYANNSNSSYWSTANRTNSWKAQDTWNVHRKRETLENALKDSQNEDKLFLFSGAATPDDNGNFLFSGLASLQNLADQTNPVVLGWVKNEWSKKRLNIIEIDFYNRTCLVPLTYALNGEKSIPLYACNIGIETSWSKQEGGMAAARSCPKDFRDDRSYCAKPAAYGRGAGYVIWEKAKCERENSQGCEQYGAIWYPKCASGFKPIECCICTPICPNGMSDIGVSCQKLGVPQINLNDGVLIKGSSGAVFVMISGVRRGIPSPDIFNSRGYKWENIITIPDDKLNSIPVGLNLGKPEISLTDGVLIKGNDDPIFVMELGKRRWISSPDIFNSKGYKWENVKNISEQELDAIPLGAIIQ